MRAAVDGTVHFRDVRYDDQRAVMELDGSFGHTDSEDRWDDLDRDVAAAVAGDITIRLGWRQVLQACRMAAGMEKILRSRGWTGRAVACGPSCALLDHVGKESPSDPDPTRTARGA